MPLPDMHRVRNVHLIGIGGCGMSGLAKILHEMGYKVSGSDVREGVNTIRLKDTGVKVYIGHEASQVREASLIVYSSAVADNNPEMLEAKAKGIELVKRAEMLAWIMSQFANQIALAGTHGKTTTTAMLAKVFGQAQLDPTYLIGCDMDYVDGNARLGKGPYAIAEADESDRSFLCLSPTAEVITNIEADHMENYGHLDELIKTFESFTARNNPNGFIVLEGTDPNNKRLLSQIDGRTILYGFNPELIFSAKNLAFSAYNSSYSLLYRHQDIGRVELSVPGRQNISNSLAVFAVAFEYGLDFSVVANGLRNFVGVRRRFSTMGEQNGVLLIDDYAHHPTEIKATLAAARAGWPGRRIICVFQPHRYTRTMLLKDSFTEAFDDADKTIITDIYAASENPIPGISGKTIADLLEPKKTDYLPKKEQIAEQLVPTLQPGDIVLTLGAGDIYNVGKELLARLRMLTEE